MTKRLLRRIELSSLNYYTHHISPHTIPPKMTKLFSKLKLTKLFYISPQQAGPLFPSKMTKLFPNSPGNYHNHTPTSGYDQKTNTIIDPARIILKNKLSYFHNSPGNYHNHKPTSGYDQKNYYNHRPNQNSPQK